MDPVRYIFSPYVVVTSSLKVTETVVAAVHVVDVVVEVVVLVLVVEVVVAKLVDAVVELVLDPDPEPEIAISAQCRYT
jgi:hypothetical protein